MENLHDWINSAILAIFVTVLFAQNSMIKNMKILVDSFDPKKLKDIQDMREDALMQKAKLLLENNDKMQSMIKDANEQNKPDVEKIILQNITKEHDELRYFAIKVLANQNKEKRDELIKSELPLTSRYIFETFEDFHNTNS